MNSFFLTIIICICKVSLEYEFYMIGSIPSIFYANLDKIDRLGPTVLKLSLHVLLVSFLKGLCAFFTSIKKCSLNREYCKRALRDCIAGIGKKEFDDLEQRILDDAKKKSEIEVQLLDKILLPFLVIFY